MKKDSDLVKKLKFFGKLKIIDTCLFLPLIANAPGLQPVNNDMYIQNQEHIQTSKSNYITQNDYIVKSFYKKE